MDLITLQLLLLTFPSPIISDVGSFVGQHFLNCMEGAGIRLCNMGVQSWRARGQFSVFSALKVWIQHKLITISFLKNQYGVTLKKHHW